MPFNTGYAGLREVRSDIAPLLSFINMTVRYFFILPGSLNPITGLFSGGGLNSSFNANNDPYHLPFPVRPDSPIAPVSMICSMGKQQLSQFRKFSDDTYIDLYSVLLFITAANIATPCSVKAKGFFRASPQLDVY